MRLPPLWLQACQVRFNHFQRFGTKEGLFFAVMVPPIAELDAIFNIQAGAKPVTNNLQAVSLRIVAYFREVMTIFLA
jgi:hypothetical protein